MEPTPLDFSGCHLLVAGEIGLDEYIWGETHRISPEAPVPVVEVESQSLKLGLSANVAQNVHSLGAKTTLLSVRGRDAVGDQIQGLVRETGIAHSVLIQDPSRPTLRKTRILADKQHLVRVDHEKTHALDPLIAKQFREALCDLLPQADGIILQDYGKGLWNPDMMGFVQEAKQKKKNIFVDPSRLSPLKLYRGTQLLSPNVEEALILCGRRPERTQEIGKDDATLTEMAKQILTETQAEHVVITCGAHGMVALSQNQHTLERIPTFAKEVYDVTGAGDTVIAVLALTQVLNYPLATCMKIANAAAGIVVGHIGTASVSSAELEKALHQLSSRRVS